MDEFERLSVLDKLSMDRLEDLPISAPTSFPFNACIVHTDIAVGKERIALAMAICDYKGNLISLGSKLMTVLTPHLAKIKALEWATDLIERKGNLRVVWFCGSQVVVKEVKDNSKSNSWFAYTEILKDLIPLTFEQQIHKDITKGQTTVNGKTLSSVGHLLAKCKSVIGEAPSTVGSHDKEKENKALKLTQVYKQKHTSSPHVESTTPIVLTTNAFEVTSWADAFGDSDNEIDDYEDDRFVNQWPTL
ncbi:hypothetical protein FNV43_RR14812 [Rhamnella rubrinervis]|uniref:RNase H type-1 domain-containing protein n=1 Tax=Rhamnella rubrinervis TaxID=2594499 RepID=A0A8K0H3T0_9ROSA|nr:hypothetical protein FNV43_RR14812 [Rhamnella rubrinervis]